MRSVATVAALFATPLLLHLALGSAPRALYAAAAVGAVGLALVHDPFLDANCWSNCTDNVFLLHGDQSIARVLETGVLLAFLAGGIVVAVRAARRPTAALVAAAQAAYAGALLLDPAERPDDAVFAALFALRAAAVTLLSIALVRMAYTAWRTRAAVERLAAELGEAPPPGTLRAALARRLGDPGVEVVYPVDGRFIDDAGRVVPEPVAGADRAVTRIVRGDRCIAIVVHARGAAAQDELAHEIGAAARLAVENERLQAELLRRLDDLRASRAAHRRDRRRRAAAARAQPARRRPAAAARARLRPAARPLYRPGGGRRGPHHGARRRAARRRRRARGAARARPRHPPGDPHRGRPRARALGPRRPGGDPGPARRAQRRALRGRGRDRRVRRRRRRDPGCVAPQRDPRVDECAAPGHATGARDRGRRGDCRGGAR